MSTLAFIAIAALFVLSFVAVRLRRNAGAAQPRGATRQSRLVRRTDGANTTAAPPPTRSALIPRARTTAAETPTQVTHTPHDTSQAAADLGYSHGRAGQPYANPYDRFRGRRDNPDYLAYHEAYRRGRNQRGPATMDTEDLAPQSPRHGHRARREAFLRSLEDF